jgi:hypothetical protein
MQFRAPLTVLLAVATTGCASTVTAWKNDPLQSYSIKESSIYAMTGDRRTAVLLNPANSYRFCAESLPDAVAAYSAASKGSAGVKDKVTGAFEDATYAGLMQTFQRTEIAEIYRQLGWNMCLAWAQGAIGSSEYAALLTKFADKGLEAITTRAGQDQKFSTVAPVTLNVGAGGSVGAAVSNAAKPAEEAKKKPEINLGGDIKLVPTESGTGYCIKAAADYKGGSPGKPEVTTDLPLCK